MSHLQQWQKPEKAPRDHWPMVVCARITCQCGEGGIVVLSASRVGGEWVIQHFEHSFEITGFMTLRMPPLDGLN